MSSNYDLPDNRKDWTPAEDALNQLRRENARVIISLRARCRHLIVGMRRVVDDCDANDVGESRTVLDVGVSSKEIENLLGRLATIQEHIELLEWVCQETEPHEKRESGDE